MALPQTSIVITEPPTQPKRKAATKTTVALQRTHKQKRSSPSITESDESRASTQTCPPNLSSNSAPARQKRRQMLKQQQIQNKSIDNQEHGRPKSRCRRNELFSRPLFTNTDVPNTVLRFSELLWI